MKKLLPILLIVLGLGGGVGAGIALKPAPPPASKDDVEAPEKKEKAAESEAIPDPGDTEEKKDETEIKARTYVSVGTQTIVPVVDGERTRALMLFELAVDVDPSAHDQAVMVEPRLRDAFLRVLMKMSSTGAFTETYTENWVLDELRRNLGSEARRFLGDSVRDVLILDVIRQEL